MWQAPREKGGTNGMVPYRHIEKLMVMARDRAVTLRPENFIPVLDALKPEDAA